MSKSDAPRWRLLLTVVVAVGLVAACTDSPAEKAGDGQQGVATIATASPSSSVTPSNERPLILTDMSPEETNRLYDAWTKCLEDNGMPPKSLDTDTPEAKKATAACASKEPETVWERAKRLDPEYGDKLRDWVTCIRANGIDAWESNGFLTFNSLPSDEQTKHVNECQKKVFGG